MNCPYILKSEKLPLLFLFIYYFYVWEAGSMFSDGVCVHTHAEALNEVNLGCPLSGAVYLIF